MKEMLVGRHLAV